LAPNEEEQSLRALKGRARADTDNHLPLGKRRKGLNRYAT